MSQHSDSSPPALHAGESSSGEIKEKPARQAAGEKPCQDQARVDPQNAFHRDRSDGDDDDDDLAVRSLADSDVEKNKNELIDDGLTAPLQPTNSELIRLQSNAERYQRFSRPHKAFMVAMVAFSTMQVPFTTTSFLPCVPEIAATFGCTQELLTGTNGIASAFMMLSPLLFGPLTEFYGRKPLMITCALFFSVGSLVTALSPSLAVFVVFRCVNCLGGTSFFSMGASIVSDLYAPTERATAMSWVLSGSQIGPAIGPVIGGLMVSYTSSWRNLFWLQFAMAALLVPLYFIFLPETAFSTKHQEVLAQPENQGKKFIPHYPNPLQVILLFRFPNVMLAGLMSAGLLFNMYILLTPIRQVMDPRFHLTTPVYGALFYLPPAAGYLVGTFIGGRWADGTVKKWVKKRGRRMPEDRLRSTIIPFGLIVPGSSIVYGWCLEEEKGGMAVPIVCMFLCGIAQTVSYASINTYCVDSMPRYGSDTISGNYAIRYLAQAVATSTALIMINSIGVGGACTISAGILWAAFVGSIFLIQYGERMRKWMDGKDEARRAKKSKKKEARNQDTS